MPVDGKFGHVTLGKQPGTPVPDDMPCFVLLARDAVALSTLNSYLIMAMEAGMPPEGQELVRAAWLRFRDWQTAHPEQMKVPSITMKAADG